MKAKALPWQQSSKQDVLWLEDKQALVLGDKATLLSLNTKQLSELEEPSTSRLFAGVLKYQSLIYAFGG